MDLENAHFLAQISKRISSSIFLTYGNSDIRSIQALDGLIMNFEICYKDFSSICKYSNRK